MAVSAGPRIASALFAAAIFIAAFPASAQTNDPNLTQEDLDCLARQSTGGGDCVPGQPPASDAAASPNAVLLPELIVDLFPNPPPVPPTPAEPATAADSTPASPPPPADTAAPSPPVVPGSQATIPPTAAPVAITGPFVPDEVLVTVDGDAAVAADIATAFGLEIRSQRTSALLGSTLVRYGIPDGRPVGVVLAQLAGDGRTTRRAPNSIYDLQQAAGAVNYAFQRIALVPDSASGEDVNVAVIDTAIDETHPAIKDAIAGQFDAMPGIEVTARDHGTSVVGLIAGTGEFRGMAPGSKIYHARAFEGGKSNMDIILSALDWAAEQDVRIINMSFVGPKNELAAGSLRRRARTRHRAGRRRRQQRPQGSLRLSSRL